MIRCKQLLQRKGIQQIRMTKGHGHQPPGDAHILNYPPQPLHNRCRADALSHESRCIRLLPLPKSFVFLLEIYIFIELLSTQYSPYQISIFNSCFFTCYTISYQSFIYGLFKFLLFCLIMLTSSSKSNFRKHSISQ